MNPVVIIFTPFIRLLAHSFAATAGFCGIAGFAMIGFKVIHSLELGSEAVSAFKNLEVFVLWVDVVLFGYVTVVYSIYFLIEQTRAIWTLCKLETADNLNKKSVTTTKIEPHL
jgi:hypothetical protein